MPGSASATPQFANDTVVNQCVTNPKVMVVHIILVNTNRHNA